MAVTAVIAADVILLGKVCTNTYSYRLLAYTKVDRRLHFVEVIEGFDPQLNLANPE
jgi:hypothetical protein